MLEAAVADTGDKAYMRVTVRLPTERIESMYDRERSNRLSGAEW